MAGKTELLRKIPKVDELLADCAVVRAAGGAPVYAVTQAVRQVLEELREAILNDTCGVVPETDGIAELIARRIRVNETPSLRRLINATGVILHTNLGRAPLAKSAVEAVCSVAESYSTLEYNVADGARGSRYSHVVSLLQRLTGAEDALVVNNNAAAVMLILSSLVQGKEVVVSRGELVEIGGAFRIPDVMAQSGCVLKEVGATNCTHPGDYEAAIDPARTGALFKAHTSNFRITGFTKEVSVAQLVELGKRHALPVLYDLGSGALISLEPAGIHDEPCVTDIVKLGVDVVSFSGDKLLGGPQAGIILGKQEYIAKMKKNPLTRAVRIDKMTLAALEATLRLYADEEMAKAEIPALRMLLMGQQELRDKANRLTELLVPLGEQVRVVDEEGQVGGGAVPTKLLPSAAVEIAPRNLTVTLLEKQLRSCETPIVARISHDRLLLDVRTVEEEDFRYIADCLKSALE